MTFPIHPEADPLAPAETPADVVVGLSYSATSSGPFLMHLLRMHAASMGIKLLDHTATSVLQQVRSIARLSTESIHLLMVVAHTPDDPSMVPALMACEMAGIPVLSLGSPETSRSPAGPIFCALCDAQDALARHVFERLEGKGKVVYVHEDDFASDAAQRMGMRYALQDFPQIEIVWMPASAMSQRIKEHRDAGAILAMTDTLAAEAIATVKALGIQPPPLVVGFGGSAEGLLAVERGELSATVKIDDDRLAKDSLLAALLVLGHDPASDEGPHVFDIVTQENLERVALQIVRSDLALKEDMTRRSADARRKIDFLETVLDNIPLNLFVKDAKELRYLLINKAREEWFGIRRADQLGKSARDMYPPELADRFESSDRRVLQSQPDHDLPQDEDHLTRGPKGPRYVQTRKQPIYGDDGRPIYLVGTSLDTTERKLAQLALAQRNIELEAAQLAMKEQQTQLIIAEKMASLGRLSAGIAHEMNTPLAAVRGAMSELLALADEYSDAIGNAEVSPDDHKQIADEMKKSIALAEKSAARAASFVRGINTQVRGGEVAPRTIFNAVQIIQDSILLLSHALHAGKCSTKFVCDSFEGTPEKVELYGVPARLAQVVTNLLTNAIDASVPKGGGVIFVELVSAGERLSLRVTDQGVGIPAENVSNIFEPLFTTKPFGGGTGLGLAIVHDIVTGEFGGTIEVRSIPGKGTTIELFLRPEIPTSEDEA